MSKPHRYIRNPEFTNLEKFVWEGFNRIGSSIPQIERREERTMAGRSINKTSANKPIWHTKAEMDKFVAGELGLRLEDYGEDKGRNQLYKAIANEVGKLRRAGVIIDWRTVKPSKTGMGVWRLDKTKLGDFVYGRARQELKNKNFRSEGNSCMVFVREKQNAFRNELFAEYGKCALCGFKIPDYMIGAHIVPYAVMREEDPDNSMNPANGLLLCRFCDVAFEKGSIIVEPDYGIEISEYLKEQDSAIVKSWLEPIPAELYIKSGARYRPAPKYLKWKKKLLKDI